MSNPSSTPTSQDLVRYENEKKSAGVALLLCWLGGLFGAHRFYMNKPHAKTMLFISLISTPLCLFLIGIVGILITWIWTISDLFKVSGWVREHNTALLAKIQNGNG